METLAIIAIFVLAVIAIHFIPDRYKPWWEQRRGLGDRHPED